MREIGGLVAMPASEGGRPPARRRPNRQRCSGEEGDQYPEFACPLCKPSGFGAGLAQASNGCIDAGGGVGFAEPGLIADQPREIGSVIVA